MVYISPEFTLYNAPPNHSVILPTQVNKFLKKLNTEYSKLNEGHENLAKPLVSLDLVDSPFATYPQYSYESLRKGIINCFSCHGQSTYVKGNKVECRLCGAKESLDAAVLRGVQELKMLFPEMKITTNLVFEWCGGIVSKKMIARILKENFQAIGYGQWTYYK